jgi:hypothetical protein
MALMSENCLTAGRRHLQFRWLWACFLLATMVFPAVTNAENYQTTALEYVNGEQIPADDVANFKKYISQTELGKNIFERPDSQNIAAARQKFVKTFFVKGKAGPPREALLQLSLEAIKAALAKPGSEAVKLNAVLLAGELTDVTGADFNTTKFSAKGLEFLVSVLSNDKSSESLKDAALVGIKRHAESHRESVAPRDPTHKGFQMDSASLKAITKECLNLVQSCLKASTSATDGQQVLARKSCEVLALLGDPGPQDAHLAAVYEAITSPNLRLPIRCGIAQYAGEFIYTEKSKPSAGQMAQAVLDLAKLSCHTELDWAKKQGKPIEPKRMYLRLQPLADCFGDANGRALRLQGIVKAAAKCNQTQAVAASAKSFREISEYLLESGFKKSKLLEMIGPPKAAATPVAERTQ